MASTAQIIIEVNETSAAKAFKDVGDQSAALQAELQAQMRATAAVSKEAADSMLTDTTKVREGAALLKDDFGINIPRALRTTIAESSLAGPALQAAFGGLAAIAFIGIAEHVGTAISGVIDKMLGWSEQAKKTMDAQTQLNKTFVDSSAQIDNLKKTYDLIGLGGLPLLSKNQQEANQRFVEGASNVATLTARLAQLTQTAKETQTVGVVDIGTGVVSGTTEEPTAAATAAIAKIADLNTQLATAQENQKVLGQETLNTGKDFSVAFSKEQADGILQIATSTQEAITKMQAMTAAAQNVGQSQVAVIQTELTAKQEELAMFIAYYGDDERARQVAAAASVAIEKAASDARIKILTEEADKQYKLDVDTQTRTIVEDTAAAAKQRSMEDQTVSLEKAAAVAMAPEWERANVAIVASYEERMAKIRAAIASGQLDEQHATREQTAALQTLYAERANLLASQMQSLFDAITTGNIGQYFLKKFEAMVFQMVATWIVGMQKMQSSSQSAMGSGGGILGAIFGALGLGGLSGGASAQGGLSGLPGVITNATGGGADAIPIAGAGTLQDLGLLSGIPGFSTGGSKSSSGDLVSGAGGLSLAGIGLSAGGGLGAPGTTLPAGAGPVGLGGGLGAGGIGGLISKLFPNAGEISPLKLMAGIGLLGATFGGGGVLNGLGGALGGFLAGGEIGALFGPAGVAIGAVIGAIAGFLGGFFQTSTRKARLAIEADIKKQAQAVEDSYNTFQMDAPTSLSQLEALRTQGVDALKKAGVKDISRSRVGHVDQWIDKAEKDINATQAERDVRTAMVFGPAEFRTGGFVAPGAGGAMPAWFAASAMRFAGGGGVPAILHPGEFVMRPEAVTRFGAAKFASMNAGGGDVHHHFYINAIDAKSFDQFLSSGGAAKIVRHLRRGQSEGAW